MNTTLQSWSRGLCTITGVALAGPSGAVIGGLAGGLLATVLPGPTAYITAVLGNVAAQAIQRAGVHLSERLTPPEKQRINHDLQTAFRDSCYEALYDLGGERCFPRVWGEKLRDVPPGLVYPLTPQGDRLWRENRPLAEQVSACFQDMERALAEQRLIPLDPPTDQPAADVRRYLDAETPQALDDAFFDQVIAPFLADYGALRAEVPDLEAHLRQHLLDRILVHLGEMLKERPRAWRAFNRLMLTGMRDQLRELGAGQEEIVTRLDALLAQPDAQVMAGWADGLADLVAATGQIEKQLDEGFDAMLSRVVAQHAEVMARLDGLLVVSMRIETKVDRVLHILEDGRYTIEGTPSVAIDAPPAPGDPPFKGLQYFDEADASLFFGRELLTAKLVARLRPSPSPAGRERGPGGEGFLAVVGASGSGKSSEVRAGLIPALRSGEPLIDGTRPPGDSARWAVHVITPTAHPLAALAASLTRDVESVTAAATLIEDLARDPRSLGLAARQALSRADAPHLLLVVDQFEELFTLCRSDAERQAFVDNLVAAVEPETAGPVTVVIALRADFYAPCAQFAALRELLAQHQEYIGPMSADELRRAIEEPARRGGWEFERGLVNLIVRDVGDEPGALPLLSHALLETWRCRRGRTMTLESYAESGGVRGAIAKTAETVFRQQLTTEQQAIARGIFLRLTEPGEGTQDTRRRASLAELAPSPEEAPAVEAVLKTLVDARLVTTGEGTAEVAHEALIREWPTLRHWLDESREILRVHRRLTGAAQEWERVGRDEGLLYRGARLAEASEWADAHAGESNALEREFLVASQSAAEHEATEREAQRQRELEAARRLAEAEKVRAEEQARAALRLHRRAFFLASALAAAVIFLLAAFSSAWLALQQRDQADQQRIVASHAQATAEAASVQARAQQATAVAERSRAEAQGQIALSRQLAAQTLTRLDDRLDVALLLSLEANRITDTLEARSSLLVALEHNPRLLTFLHGHQGYVTSVAFSPAPTEGGTGGQMLASGDLLGAIILRDATTGRVLTGHKLAVSSLAFSPDGKILASGSWDQTIILWDVTTGQQIGQPLTGHQGQVWSVAFPDLKVWTGSPDGRTLISGGADKTIIRWDVASHQPIGQPLVGHTDMVYSVAYSPDGKMLASGSGDKTVRLWDAATGQPIGQPLTGHTEAVQAVAFSPDGKMLASGALDNTVIRWDVATRQPIGQPLTGHTGWVMSLAFPDLAAWTGSPGGKMLASGSYDGTIILWDAVTGQQIGQPLTGHTGPVSSLSFPGPAAWTSDLMGPVLASGSWDRTVILWDVSSALSAGRPPIPSFGQRLTGQTQVSDLAYNPAPPDGGTGGGMLAVGGLDNTIVLWDTTTGQPIGKPLTGHTSKVECVAFSPAPPEGGTGGKILASGDLSGAIIRWDVATGQPIGQPFIAHQGAVSSLAYSPAPLGDGTQGLMLASAGNDNTIMLWDAATGQPIRSLSGHTNWGTSVAFPGLAAWTGSANGKVLASGSLDGTIILWDVATGQPIHRLTGHRLAVSSVAFSPDGKLLASGSWDQTLILWDVATGQPIGRPLVGHRSMVERVAFPDLKAWTGSPGGQMVASSSQDGVVILWDVATGQPIGQPLVGHSDRVLGLAFSPGGKVLASGSWDKTIILWDISLEGWQTCACRIAHRNLTRAEWELYLPGQAYRKTCEGWPLEP